MDSRRVQFLLFALLVIQSSTAEKCKPFSCFSSNQSPVYKPVPGQQYTYDFESSATSQLVNKETVETSVAIRGQAVISAGQNCGFTLTLQNVIASGSDNSKQQVKDFSTHPVQFTLSGDEISPEICADVADNVFSLNVKRGIISAFQNSFGDNSQTQLDIFGKCPTISTSSTVGGTTTITRSRDLDKCAYREKLVSGLIQNVVTESSEVKTSPLLNGNVESEAKYQNGILQSTEIRETYDYLPFSVNEHGAKAKVLTKLTLKKTGGGAAGAPKNGVLRSILFGNANENLASSKVKESIKTAFDKTLKEFTDQEGKITSSAAPAFAELVRLMRLGKKADLTVSYQSMKSNTLSPRQSANKALSRSIFLDALFRTGTGDAVSALVALSQKEFDEKEKQLMYLSFNLVTSPTKESITELAKLFKENLPKEAYLSIGNVVSKYCRERNCDANEVKPIADKFAAKIPKDCVTKTKKDEEHLVAVLKGIRNSQTILNSALNNIIACVGSQRPIRVRVAALQAFSANPCNKKLQQSAIGAMKNREEDSEVRIEAYLTAMECPSGNLANEVVAMLESETINQVGTFVNTHLDSIKASTDPKRENARHHFRNVRTTRKFPFDPRRYSFNRETSYAIDSLGLGSSVDTSVIYSQRSFLPRSLRLNVTGNLFGNAFNFFELSARQENLEDLIEHYFGPRGFFNRLSKQELYDEFVKEFSSFQRNKRSLPQDLTQFDKSVKLSSEYNRDPDIDLSVKIFGSELYFLSMSQSVPSTPSELVKLFASEAQKGLDALKNFNYNFENHALWLDSEVVYPSALGLPLKLSATGASAVKVDLSGSIDVKAILENPLESRAEVNFSPAANIFIAASIGFNSYAFESGIEVSGTIFTNTGANTTVEMQGGRNFIVKTIPTHNDQYVVDLRHQINTVTQESGREAVKVPVPFKGSDDGSEMCFDQLEFLIGAAVCLEMQTTSTGKADEHAMWPLYGSTHFGLKLDTADSITFRAELDFSDPEQPSLNFYHDTPDNGRPRQTSLKLLSSIKPTHYFGGFALSVPWLGNTFAVDGKVGFVNQDSEKKIYASGSYEGQKHEYEIGFRRKGGSNIEPILKLNTDYSYISGKIVEKKTQRDVTYELKQIKFGRDNYQTTIDGTIKLQHESELIANLKIDVSGRQANFDGTFSYQPGGASVDFTLRSNQIPTANGKVKYDLFFWEKKVSNDLLIVWDKNLNDKSSRVEWAQLADWGGENVKLKNELTVGKWNAAGRLNGEFGKKVISLDTSLQYQKSSAELKVENKYSQKTLHDYETSIYAAANKKSIRIDMSRDIEGDSSKIKNKIELSTGLRVELNGKVSHKLQYRDADVSLQGVFVPGPRKEQTKVVIVLKNNQKGHEGSVKVVTGKTEVATTESKLTYGNDMKGYWKASIKDSLTVDSSLESKLGKGKADLTITLKSKKVHAETTFTIQKPTFDLTTDFYYDYEKDNTKKVHFSTQNKIEPQSIDSKNSIEVFSEKYAINVAASTDGKFPSGKQKYNVELHLPTGRKFVIDGNREMTLEDGKGQGKAHFTATDELPNRQQRQLIVDVKVNDLNVKQSFFDFVGSLKYKNYDNKDIKVSLNLKNLAKGHFSTANGNLQIDGALMPHTLTSNVRLDEYCSEHAIYSFDGRYGDLGDSVLSGKFYAANKDRPYSHEFSGTLNVPKSQLKSITLRSKGEVREPADENGVYGVKYEGSLEYTGNKVQFDTELNFSNSKGTGNAKLQLPNQKPISGDFKYNCNHQDSADISFNVNYGNGKRLSSTLKGQRPNENNFNFAVTLQGNLDNFKDISLNYDAKRNSPDNYAVKMNGKVDGKPYQLDYEHRLSRQHPKLLISWTCPQRTSKFLIDLQLETTLKGKGTLSIENLYDFNYLSNFEGDFSSIETFYIRGDVDSPILNMNKLTYDVHSKSTGGKTGFEYKMTSNGALIISGVSDFTTKTEKGRTIFEGKSTARFKDGKSGDVTFKVIRNVYERDRDGEIGFAHQTFVTIGQGQYNSELKLTDKEFNIKLVVCEKKGTCSNIQGRTALERADMEGFRYILESKVDLRPVGFPHQYSLKSETSREGLTFKHNTDSSLFTTNANNPEYRYSAYIDEKRSEISFKIPKREVLLDARYSYPQRFYGNYQTNIAFYIDKNKPQLKSELGFSGDVSHSGNVMRASGKVVFTHPRVKTLGINGVFNLNADQMTIDSNVEFDVFSNPNDKIILVTKFGNSDISGRGFNVSSDIELYSRGLDFKFRIHEHAGLSFERRLVTYGGEFTLPVNNWNFGVHAFASDTNFEVIGILFNQEVLKTNAVYDLSKNDFAVENSVRYISSDPLLTKANIHGLTEGTFTMSKGRLLSVDGGYGLGKDIHLKVLGSGREVFNGNVALDTSHFLKTTYKVDNAQVKALSEQLQEQIKKDVETAQNDFKSKFETIVQHRDQRRERIIKALPDFRQFTQEYMREINSIVDEIKNDPNIQKFYGNIAPFIETVSKYFEDFVTIFGEQYAIVQDFLTQIYKDFVTGFNERILPEIRKLFDQIQELVRELIGNATKATSALIERASKALKEFEDDFNKISQSFKDLTGGTVEALTQYVKEITQEIKELYGQFREQIKNLPGLSYIKEKYSEYFGNFTPLHALAAVIEELLTTIKDFVPDQAKPFFDKTIEYINRKVSGEDVNDFEFFKQIYELFRQATEVIRREILEKLNVESSSIPISFNALKRIPPFISNIRSSAFNRLTNEPIISIKDVLYLYRPYAFNPAESLPPFTMHGEIADGSHFFTFDGRHFTFSGGCNYILARDFAEGNFSIVANMKDGKVKSVTVGDKNGWIEVNADGAIKYKDKDSEFPIHDKTLHAWRNFNTFSILTQFGAGVECSNDLTLCHVEVSGFYTGKTRGLMGNGNGEPYDDYTLPDGKITETTTDFGNAYRTQKNCATPSTSGDSHPKSHSNEFCSQFFGRDSSLRLGFLFVDPSNYREACEHATHGASNAQSEACKIARIYASRCRQEFIPVSVPKACEQCQAGRQKVEIGDEVSVKVPQKEADIVVVFDTALEKGLTVVTEIVNELRKDLRTQGVSDVQVAAIGFSSKDRYFSIYTTKGKLDFKGKFESLRGSGVPEEETIVTGNGEIDDFVEELKRGRQQNMEDLSLSPDARAFQKAFSYPFRATATKTILAVRGNGIPYSLNPSKLASAKLSVELAAKRGISVHALMPVDIKEPADKAKNIVGFNANVALLINEKKRPNMGSVEMAQKMKYSDDMGVDLTRQQGFVFNLNNYNTDKKKFVGIVSYVLADSIARNEVVSDCVCELQSGIYPQTKCEAKSTQLLPPKKAPARG